MLDRRTLLKSGALGGLGSLIAASAPAAPEPSAKRPRGVIFLVADGMSGGVLPMVERFSSLARDHGTRWWELLDRSDAVHGLMDTASANSAVTDSAAASTAWGSGRRTNNGRINVSPDGSSHEPIAAVLGRKGVRTGLVTTATITHATPAGFAASLVDRDDEEAIAPQYLDHVELLLGGGASFFDPACRRDGRDLRADYRKAGFQVVDTAAGLGGSTGSRLLGLFADGHLPYSVDHRADAELRARVPTLAAMTRIAIDRLLAAGTPFLLQVEGARVDHGAHANDAAALLWDQLAFDDALGVALEARVHHPDLLVVATSDHGNSNPGLNGMGDRYVESNACFRHTLALRCSHEWLLPRLEGTQGDPAAITRIVGEKLGYQLKPQEALALGQSMSGGEFTEWNTLLANPAGLLGQFSGNRTGIGWTGTTHTADPTLVTATGPLAGRFAGLIRNDEVFGILVEALC